MEIDLKEIFNDLCDGNYDEIEDETSCVIETDWGMFFKYLKKIPKDQIAFIAIGELADQGNIEVKLLDGQDLYVYFEDEMFNRSLRMRAEKDIRTKYFGSENAMTIFYEYQNDYGYINADFHFNLQVVEMIKMVPDESNPETNNLKITNIDGDNIILLADRDPITNLNSTDIAYIPDSLYRNIPEKFDGLKELLKD